MTTLSSITTNELSAAMREYGLQKRRCQEENGRLRAILKRHKAGGVPVRAMVEVTTAMKLDLEEVMSHLRNVIRLNGIKGRMIGQGDLFDNLDVTTLGAEVGISELADAEDCGYVAGKNGADKAECPWLQGTAEFVEWNKGYMAGQAYIAEQMGPNAKQADQTRARPKRAGRPPETGSLVSAVPNAMEQEIAEQAAPVATEGTLWEDTPMADTSELAAADATEMNTQGIKRGRGRPKGSTNKAMAEKFKEAVVTPITDEQAVPPIPRPRRRNGHSALN